jgi:ABC-type transport system substrate-binding protein
VAGDDARSTLRQRIQRGFIQDMDVLGMAVTARTVPSTEMDPEASPNGIVARRSFDVLEVENNQRSGLVEYRARFTTAGIPTAALPTGLNLMGFSNAIVDQAFADLSRTLDGDQRRALLDRIQETIYTQIPVVPIYTHLEIDAARAYVQGLDPGPTSGLWWNVEDWWVDKERATK